MLNDPSILLQDELQPGEQLLWSGRPPRGLILHAYDAFLIPFSIFWMGFVIV
jgi:hypothetical protein